MNEMNLIQVMGGHHAIGRCLERWQNNQECLGIIMPHGLGWSCVPAILGMRTYIQYDIRILDHMGAYSIRRTIRR